MAANTKQGQWFGLFLAGLTATCAGILGFSGALGKMSVLLGIIVLAVSCLRFIKLKSLEGKIALGSQPAGMKLVGLVVILLGWGVVLFGLHLTSSIGGRMATSIIGLLVSLVGIVVILPAACNKNAIWKA
jgi:hypothetical protein